MCRTDREEAEPAAGVQASVHYATGKASVLLPPGVSADAAIATVEATGYNVRLPEPPRPTLPRGDDREAPAAGDKEVTALRRRLLIPPASRCRCC